jgi:hypothetical protein
MAKKRVLYIGVGNPVEPRNARTLVNILGSHAYGTIEF